MLLDSNSEEKIKKLNLKVLSELECYNELLKRKDIKLKFAVLYLIEKSNTANYKPLLELVLINETNKKIRTQTENLLRLIS